MALSIQDSRILLKRSTNASEAPTAAPSNDFTDGTWTSLDVYVGEAFANTVDEKLYLRFTNNIRQIAVADSPTTNRLTYWNASGHLGNIAAPTDGYYLKYTNASGYIWETAGGAESQDWNDVLTLGRITDGVNPFVSAGDAIEWHNTTASFTTTLTNDQATAANRTVYLPIYDGTLTYKTTTLNSNYILKGTTNEAIVSSSLIYDNGTNVGIGTTTPTAIVHIKGSTSDSSAYAFKADNSSSSAILYARNDNRISIGTPTNPYNMSVWVNTTGTTEYGFGHSKNEIPLVIAGHTSIGGFMSLNDITGGTRIVCFNDSTGGFGTVDYINTGRDLGIGNRAATAKAHITGSTSDSSAYALKVDNSSGSALLYVRNDGNVGIGTASPSFPFHYSASSNTYVQANISNTNTDYSSGLSLGNGNNISAFYRINSADTTLHIDYRGSQVLSISGHDNTSALATIVNLRQTSETESWHTFRVLADSDNFNTGYSATKFIVTNKGRSGFNLGTTYPTAYADISGSTTTNASLRIRSGTAPTTPNDGDIWFDGTDIKMRIGGVTKVFTLV